VTATHTGFELQQTVFYLFIIISRSH